MLVSVIIPTYSREERVKQAVRSVLDQTVKTLECIVVDDGSEDGTVESIRSLSDHRVTILSQSRSGVSAARNAGVRESSGEQLTFLDSDDIWHPEKLARQIEFHRRKPDLRISQTREIWIRGGKRVNPKVKHQKPSGYIFPESLHLCTISPSSVFMERELFDEFGGFDERLPACEDYDLWLRITSRVPVGLLDEPLLTKFGGHADQLSGLHPAMDRFRIYALGKILLSGTLSEKQTRQVMDVLREKTKILLNGAEKRNMAIDDTRDLIEDLMTMKLSMTEFIRKGQELLLSGHRFNASFPPSFQAE